MFKSLLLIGFVVLLNSCSNDSNSAAKDQLNKNNFLDSEIKSSVISCLTETIKQLKIDASIQKTTDTYTAKENYYYSIDGKTTIIESNVYYAESGSLQPQYEKSIEEVTNRINVSSSEYIIEKTITSYLVSASSKDIVKDIFKTKSHFYIIDSNTKKVVKDVNANGNKFTTEYILKETFESRFNWVIEKNYTDLNTYSTNDFQVTSRKTICKGTDSKNFLNLERIETVN